MAHAHIKAPSPTARPVAAVVILGLCAAVAGCSGKGDDTGGLGTTAEIGPCGAYSSASTPGAEWVWELSPTYQTQHEIEGGWTTLAKGSETYAGSTVWLLQETAEYSSVQWPDQGTQVEWRLVCDDEGVKVLQFEGVWSRTNNIGTEAGWWAADFDEPQLLQPATMAVGDSWSIDTSYTYTGQKTTGTRMNLTASYVVTDQRTVEVDAGSYDAFAVDVDWSGDPRTDFEADSYTKLVAPEVGDVQLQDRADLVRWDIDPTFGQED